MWTSADRWKAFIVAAAFLLLGSPVFAQELKLDALIEEALKNNPDILVSRTKIEAAKFRVPQAKSLPDPMVSMGYQNVGLSRYSYGDYPESQWMFTASQMFPYFGKRELKGEMAQRDVESLQAMDEALRLRTIARVKELYYDLFLSYKNIDILKDKTDLFSRIEETSLARYKAGKSPQQEVVMAQTEKYMLFEKEEMFKQKILSTEAMLRATIGRDAKSPLGKPAEPSPTPFSTDMDTVLKKAYEQSPEIKSRERMVEAAKAKLAMSKKEYYPDVTIGASVFPRGNDFQEIWGLTATFNIPVYSGTKQGPGVQEAGASLSQARHELDSMNYMIAAAVQDNYSMLKAADKLMDLYKSGLIPKTYQDFELALSGYSTGGIEAIVVITRLKTLLDYDILYWGQFVEREKAIARLCSIAKITDAQKGVEN
ncbi:MAG TPA: TolC family protein [Syntrophales bacterium]|nr:TolC family protein [Syntrophales bacterium]